MSNTADRGPAEYQPRLETDVDRLRLLESRRDALLERAERIAVEQRLSVSRKHNDALATALEAALERERVLTRRVDELQTLTDEIFRSRRWRIWNQFRYLRRGVKQS